MCFRTYRLSSHMPLKQPRWAPDLNNSHCPNWKKTDTSVTTGDQRVQSDPWVPESTDPIRQTLSVVFPEEREMPQQALGSEVCPLLKLFLRTTSPPENRCGDPEETRGRFDPYCVSVSSGFLITVSDFVSGLWMKWKYYMCVTRLPNRRSLKQLRVLCFKCLWWFQTSGFSEKRCEIISVCFINHCLFYF